MGISKRKKNESRTGLTKKEIGMGM